MTEILASNQIPKNIQVEDKTQYKPIIHFNVQKMNRVFTNTITNAVYAMSEGGKLTITSRKLDDNVEFSFTDTGEGIPYEVKEKYGPLSSRLR